MKVVGGVRMVRNKLTEKQATTIVTAQIFSILYYACCVWLTPSLNLVAAWLGCRPLTFFFLLVKPFLKMA